MIWACIVYYGVGSIYWIKTVMDQHVYVDILQIVMLPYAEDEMPFICVFQQDIDPKHTSKKAKKWFADNVIDIMEWPAQSLNLWTYVKRAVHICIRTANDVAMCGRNNK